MPFFWICSGGWSFASVGSTVSHQATAFVLHMENSKFNCLYPMTTFCEVNFRLRLVKVNKKRMVLNAQWPCEHWKSRCLILLNAQWFSCVSSKLTILLCLIYQIWLIPLVIKFDLYPSWRFPMIMLPWLEHDFVNAGLHKTNH